MGILDRLKKMILKSEDPTPKVEIKMVGLDGPKPNPKKKRELIQPKPVCPYCGFRYDDMPKDKKPCPSCGQIVIIKSQEKIKHLFTVDQAKEWESDKKDKTLINKARSYLTMGRMDPDDLQKTREFMKEASGKDISYVDVVFRMLSEEALDRHSQRDFDGAFWTYFAMAHLLLDQGRDFFEAWKLAQEMKLSEIKLQDPKAKVRVSSGCDCPACQDIKKKILPINEALKTMPYPTRGCTDNFPFSGRYVWFVE